MSGETESFGTHAYNPSGGSNNTQKKIVIESLVAKPAASKGTAFASSSSGVSSDASETGVDITGEQATGEATFDYGIGTTYDYNYNNGAYYYDYDAAAYAAYANAASQSSSNSTTRPPKSKKGSGKEDPKMKKIKRKGGGEEWEDPSLLDWPDNDYRIFVGDLGNEVNDEMLRQAFIRYSSYQKSKVIRDKKTGKTRGYGFVSFSDARDFARAMREMNGKYIGNRPVKLRRSKWEDRCALNKKK